MHLLFVHLLFKHPHIEDKYPHIPDPFWRLWTSLFLSQRLLCSPTPHQIIPAIIIPSWCLRIMMHLYINSSYYEIEEGVAGYYYYFFHPTTKRCGITMCPQWIRLLVNKSSSRHKVKSPQTCIDYRLLHACCVVWHHASNFNLINKVWSGWRWFWTTFRLL